MIARLDIVCFQPSSSYKEESFVLDCSLPVNSKLTNCGFEATLFQQAIVKFNHSLGLEGNNNLQLIKSGISLYLIPRLHMKGSV